MIVRIKLSWPVLHNVVQINEILLEFVWQKYKLSQKLFYSLAFR